jgi:hypothetical protein
MRGVTRRRALQLGAVAAGVPALGVDRAPDSQPAAGSARELKLRVERERGG